MLPGPTIIRQCAVCAQPFRQETLLTGNTFGATFWTDGKMEAPMLPENPDLIQCPHCQALLWIEAQEVLGKVGWGDRDTYLAALDYRTPAFEDYLTFLESGSFSLEQERDLRLHIWWTGNDRRRKRSAPSPLSASEIMNLWGLAALADETDETDRVMKAEILRELGQFDEALALLKEQPISPPHTRVATVIQHHAEQGDAAVHEIPDEDSSHEDTGFLAEADQPESASTAEDSEAADLLAFPKDILDDALKHFHLLHSLCLSQLNRRGESTLQALVQDMIDQLEVGRDYLSMKDEDDPDVVNMTVLAISQEVIDDYALGTLDLLRNLRLDNLNEQGESALQTLVQDTILRLEITREQWNRPG